MLAVVLQFKAGLYCFEGRGQRGVRGDDLLVALEQRYGLLMGNVGWSLAEGIQVTPEFSGVSAARAQSR